MIHQKYIRSHFQVWASRLFKLENVLKVSNISDFIDKRNIREVSEIGDDVTEFYADPNRSYANIQVAVKG